MKILIADDHKIFREGLHLLLKQSTNDMQIIEASNGLEVLETLKVHKFDAVLMDIEMPLLNGIETTKLLKKGEFANIPIIALTMFNQLQNMMLAYDAGVSGYLTKDCSVKEIIQAIKQVIAGDEYFATSIRTTFLKELLKRERKGNEKSKDQLTPREKEVLIMICEQQSTEDIANALFVSPLTINNHRRSILAKTDAKNIVGMVLYAIKNGLFKID